MRASSFLPLLGVLSSPGSANAAVSSERPASTKELQQGLVLNLKQTSLWMNKSTSCDFLNLWFSQVIAMTFEALFMGPKALIL